MLLGIDVGGTFTDAVVLRQGEVVAQAKRATTHGRCAAVRAGSAGCCAAAGNGAGAWSVW